MPVFWPGEFHGLYSPQGGKESDKTEQLSLSQWERNLLLSKGNCIYPLPPSQRFGSLSYHPTPHQLLSYSNLCVYEYSYISLNFKNYI